MKIKNQKSKIKNRYRKLMSVVLTISIVVTSFSSVVQTSAQTEERASNQADQVAGKIDGDVQTAVRPSEPIYEFVIDNKEKFSVFMITPVLWGSDYKVKLSCDIDMKGKAFKPIKEFGGVFDGCGHTVSNFKIQNKSGKGKNSELALINTLEEYAEIKNITFDNYTIEGDSGIKEAAGLIVTNHGTVLSVDIINGRINNIDKKVKATGYVLNNEEDGVIENCFVGMNNKDVNVKSGFVGTNFGKITKCSTTVSVNSKDISGGFCGSNSGEISDCKANGTVKASAKKGITICGGFIAENSGIIKNCSSTGEVEGQEFTGGFAGINNDKGEISSSKARCDVKSHTYIATINVGGFVGIDAGKIEDCSFDGKVDGCVDSEKVVGIAVGVTVGVILAIATTCLLVKYYKYKFSAQKAFETASNKFYEKKQNYLHDKQSIVQKYLNDNRIKEQELTVHESEFLNRIKIADEKSIDIAVNNNSTIDSMMKERYYHFRSNGYGVEESAINIVFCRLEIPILEANYQLHLLENNYKLCENAILKFKDAFFKDSFVIAMLASPFVVDAAAGVASGSATGLTAGRKCANVAGFCGINAGEISRCDANNRSLTAKSMYNKHNMCGGFVGTNGETGTIKDCSSTGNEIHNKTYTGGHLGGFVGENSGKIENGTTTVSVANGKCTGGFCGNNTGEISDSRSEGNATANATAVETKCGGFVGENGGIVKDSTSIGSVIGQEYVGGFAGLNKYGIVDCNAHGKATAKTKTHTALAGGFIGENDKGTIISCTATGGADSRSSSGQAKAGGFVGINKASIMSSKASGNVYLSAGTFRTDDGCGGFVGKNDQGGSIDGCYAESTVETTNKKKGGGFVGEAKSKSMINNSQCKAKIVIKSGTKNNIKFCENKDKKAVIAN